MHFAQHNFCSFPRLNLGIQKKEKQALLSRYLAEAAAIFCDSILIRICWKWGKREKWRAVEGRGGWRSGAVKKVFPSLCQSSEVWGSVSLLLRYFEDTQGPGPRCSWVFVSLLVAGPLSVSPLLAPRPSGGPAAVSGVEGGPGSGGGSIDWKVS